MADGGSPFLLEGGGIWAPLPGKNDKKWSMVIEVIFKKYGEEAIYFQVWLRLFYMGAILWISKPCNSDKYLSAMLAVSFW